MSAPLHAPSLSVTVPTRGRAEHLSECVRSILACEGPPFEVIVVDQSDDRASEETLAPFLKDERLRYLRTDTRGVCAARNIGIAASRAPLLVCTDDDCRATPGWLAEMDRAFAHEPAADVIAGRVVVPDEIYAQGWAAGWDAPASRCTMEALGRFGWGITANMAFRRSVLDQIGPFDEALGSGGPLRSGGEPDLLYRALRSGRVVLNRPEPMVHHLGIRRGAEVGALFRRYLFGTGAAFWKHVRLGDAPARQIMRGLSAYLLKKMAGGLRRKLRPEGTMQLVNLWKGAGASHRFRIDPVTRLFLVPR